MFDDMRRKRSDASFSDGLMSALGGEQALRRHRTLMVISPGRTARERRLAPRNLTQVNLPCRLRM